ncbi:MAG: ParB/RepB/Spo0J family partition protein [Bryobacteraceae bacterium]
MNKAPDKARKALGKGLSALLPARPAPPSNHGKPSDEAMAEHETATNVVLSLAVMEIDPNPLQPRTVFDSNRIEELASSIRANGIIQPLIVRRKGTRYELVAGERRLRAARAAGLEIVPAVLQDFADDRLLEVALIENIQREDLNPIETAQAFDRLIRELHLNHEEVGRRTGKDRSTVTNLLRLLKLPVDVQILLAERRLSMGHARALLAIEDPSRQIELANRAAAQGYSVRDVERLVQKMAQPAAHGRMDGGGTSSSSTPPADPNVKAAVRELEDALGTRVRIIEKTDQRGRIEIEYYSQEDLQRLYGLIVEATKN